MILKDGLNDTVRSREVEGSLYRFYLGTQQRRPHHNRQIVPRHLVLITLLTVVCYKRTSPIKTSIHRIKVAQRNSLECDKKSNQVPHQLKV